MPRTARLTAPGWVYHVTHRGNRRGPVFFEAADREEYLRRLTAANRESGFELWSYCLMTNHVHLIGLGREKDSVGRALRKAAGAYAQSINGRHQRSGHLWSGRFYSCPVFGDHLWAAVRYVERNPVRAGLVERAQDYPWSSAAAHCGLAPPGPLSPGRPFPGPIQHWPSWLAQEDAAAEEHLRTATRLGKPAANGDDRARLEEQLERPVTLRPWGRPRRN